MSKFVRVNAVGVNGAHSGSASVHLESIIAVTERSPAAQGQAVLWLNVQVPPLTQAAGGASGGWALNVNNSVEDVQRQLELAS